MVDEVVAVTLDDSAGKDQGSTVQKPATILEEQHLESEPNNNEGQEKLVDVAVISESEFLSQVVAAVTSKKRVLKKGAKGVGVEGSQRRSTRIIINMLRKDKGEKMENEKDIKKGIKRKIVIEDEDIPLKKVVDKSEEVQEKRSKARNELNEERSEISGEEV